MGWDRLIRFIGEDGLSHYGEPQISFADDLQSLLAEGKLIAREIVGQDIFTASPTDNLLKVKRLTGPLSFWEVPIFRCVGLNYGEHIKETGRKPPPYPSIFIKSSRCAAGWDEDIAIPKIAQRDQLDYEGELAIVIGKEGKNISTKDALDYIAGYTVANDVSARTWQRDPAFAGSIPQWCFSKGFDSWAPMGPMLVSAKILGAADSLTLRTKVNGHLRQNANTNDLVFGVREIIAFVSQGTTIEKGSVILTGTPGGVILGMQSPKWLADGDVVEVVITGIGKISNKMVFNDADSA
ncbi:hypothetical protein IFR05_013312 [Cadophora sp. M221]|nr:hypothetical protein IFR05_013312 [Cadophora sp. M221]